jgi:hypothetical protein
MYALISWAIDGHHTLDSMSRHPTIRQIESPPEADFGDHFGYIRGCSGVLGDWKRSIVGPRRVENLVQLGLETEMG